MRGIKFLAVLILCALVLLLGFVIGKRDVAAAKQTSTVMVLKLISGEEVSGIITFDGHDTVELEREPVAPNLVVMKQAIAYYYEYEY